VLAASIPPWCWMQRATLKTSVNVYQTVRRNNPEDTHLHTRRPENLKSHNSYNSWLGNGSCSYQQTLGILCPSVVPCPPPPAPPSSGKPQIDNANRAVCSSWAMYSRDSYVRGYCSLHSLVLLLGGILLCRRQSKKMPLHNGCCQVLNRLCLGRIRTREYPASKCRKILFRSLITDT
jgi:hypothetical protein